MKFKRILHLSIDDLRFDSLSISPDKTYLKKYSLDKFPDTPNLDFFAREGVFFTNTYSTAPFTPPSHASMLTGLYQNKHGVRPFLGTHLNSSRKNIFEILNENGFHTISAVDFKDVFELSNILRGAKEKIVRDDKKVIEHLSRLKNDKIYLFMHIGDVHPPYGESFYPPDKDYNKTFYEDYENLASLLGIKHEPFRSKDSLISRENLIDLSNKVRIHCEENSLSDVIQFPRYLNGINKFDRGRFKTFIDSLNSNNLIDDQTLLIITSDHGQSIIRPEKMAYSSREKPLMKFDHGETITEEIIRVPLIFYSTAFKKNSNFYDGKTSTVDIIPTILDLLDFPRFELDGISLKPIITSQSSDIKEREIYAEAWYHDRKELSNYLKQSVKLGFLPEEPYYTFLYQQALIKSNYKLVKINHSERDKQSNYQLFDIKQDPDEIFDLLRTQNLPPYLPEWKGINTIFNDLKSSLLKYDFEHSLQKTSYKDPLSVYQDKEDAELIEERLRALGYVE